MSWILWSKYCKGPILNIEFSCIISNILWSIIVQDLDMSHYYFFSNLPVRSRMSVSLEMLSLIFIIKLAWLRTSSMIEKETFCQVADVHFNVHYEKCILFEAIYFLHLQNLFPYKTSRFRSTRIIQFYFHNCVLDSFFFLKCWLIFNHARWSAFTQSVRPSSSVL